MKPRITYGELAWQEAFARITALGVGKKLTANGETYKIHHWNPDPEYAWLELRTKAGMRIVRRGDVLILELCAA